MVFSDYFTWDVLPGQFLPFMRSAAEDGFTIIIPDEIIESSREQVPAGTEFIRY